MNELSVRIDWDSVEAVCGGDPNIMREVLAVFIRECPKLVRNLHIAMEAEDWKALRLLSHRLQGELRILHVPGVRDLADQLKANAYDARQRRVEQLVADLSAALDTLVQEVQQRLDQLVG